MTPRFLRTSAVVFAVLLGWTAFDASAALAPTICPHNLCTETFTIGGQDLTYEYTQHLAPGGQLRVRFDGGTYVTGDLISYILFGLPQFDAWSVLADTANGAAALPSEDVNPSRTAFERSDTNGCIGGCTVDMVMAVDFPVSVGDGAYTFSLNVIQNGDSAGRNALTFYVDASAPTNGDESEEFLAAQDMDEPCADLEPYVAGTPADNDLDYLANCADPQCDNEIGSFTPYGLCEAAEFTCDDGFDNDGDGMTDCEDPSCDLRVGSTAPLGFCQYGDEGDTFFGNDPEKGYLNVGPILGCTDGFDNDADDGLPDGGTDCADNRGGITCWQVAERGCETTEIDCSNGIDDDQDQSYSVTGEWDAVGTTGADCTDYDCAGDPACPATEQVDGAGQPTDAQCFDGVDNDLDQRTDCSDIDDCSEIFNPGNADQTCLEFEFNLAQSIQYCDDGFDNDGDDGQPSGGLDATDPDCRRAFSSCGPSPSREDYHYDSCADGIDNDADVGIDCADPDEDCLGSDYARLGSLGGAPSLGGFASAAHCASAEDDDGLCSDRSDNDGDGDIDCADADCDGSRGPDGALCASAEGICGDGADNDLDGATDCVDADCAGQGSCAAPWQTSAACRELPEHSGATPFTGNDPSITVDVIVRDHVSEDHLVRLVGSDTYDSVTMVIGDNTDPSRYYPFASEAGCVIDPDGIDPVTGVVSINTGAFSFTAIDGHFVQLFTTAPSVGAFDITLRCPTPPSPTAPADVPLSLSALKSSGNPEYGDIQLSVEAMESTDPGVDGIEPEGIVAGTVNVPYGGMFSYRVVADDPAGGGPLDSSGICGCSTDIGGTRTDSPDGGCIVTPATLFYDDAGVSVQGRSEDGADNISPWSAPLAFQVNVLPIVTVPTQLSSPPTPFIRSGEDQVGISAQFRTGTSDTFGLTCRVHVYDSDGTHRGDPNGIDAILNGTPLANQANCSGVITADLSGFGDGEYFLTVRVQDSDGDSIESNRQAIYWCDVIPGPGDPETPCSKADFDADGATEGLYTTLYSATPRACDNCVGMANPDQADPDGNGIGERCEPGEIGRCEVDRELACDCGAPPDYTAPNADAAPLRDPLDPANIGLDETSFTSGIGCQLECPASSTAVDRYFDPDAYDPAIHESDGRKIEQRCNNYWGICLGNGEICFTNNECQDGVATGCDNDEGTSTDPFRACVSDAVCGGGRCVGGFGTCTGDGVTLCRRDIDCNNQGTDGPCVGADLCTDMLFPWIETQNSNIYSGFNISAPEEPPSDNVNATFCITAKNTIRNFRSASGDCPPETVSETRFGLPKSSNFFRSVLGSIDVDGLLAGEYGQVQSISDYTQIDDVLGGKVYVHEGDLVIGDPALGIDADPGLSLRFNNGIGSGANLIEGRGTVVVHGGDLIINRDIEYSGNSITDLAHLASVAWIVLDDGSGTKGNIYVHRRVSELSGVFYADGPDPGVQMHGKDQYSSNVPLTVHGLMIARKFIFSRDYRSFDQGSERIIYDGRAVVNPPPGFGDVSKLLPQFTQSSF